LDRGFPFLLFTPVHWEGVVMGAKPDLKGSIEVIAGVKAKQLVKNGGSVSVGSGDGAEFRFYVTNQGDAPSGKFFVGANVKLNGVAQKSDDFPSVPIEIPPGLTMIYKVWFPFIHPTSEWEARLLADAGGFVAESNEANNLAAFKFTSHAVV
jgi:hypothetical protein